LTETTQVWHHVRRELGPYGQLTRIEFPVVPGTPDVCYTIKYVTGWLELKKLRTLNRCHNLTQAQVSFGEKINKAGGLWHLLGRHKATWVLYDIERARKLLNGGEACPLFSSTGPLPVTQLLKHLVPRW
jgi:hypothetical protein